MDRSWGDGGGKDEWDDEWDACDGVGRRASYFRMTRGRNGRSTIIIRNFLLAVPRLQGRRAMLFLGTRHNRV